MARPKISKKTVSSKKLRRSAEKQKKAAVRHSESESSASEAAPVRPPVTGLAYHAPDSDGIYSDNDGDHPQPSPLSPQAFDRPSEGNPASSSHERPDLHYRSQERTSSLDRSPERTSRQSSRSTRRSASNAPESADEDLLVTGYFPANPSDVS